MDCNSGVTVPESVYFVSDTQAVVLRLAEIHHVHSLRGPIPAGGLMHRGRAQDTP